MLVGGFEHAIRLNLANNKLTALPPQIGNLRDLVNLNLYNNKISVW
jgi:Leucine-rich repeat (LRR) protein